MDLCVVIICAPGEAVLLERSVASVVGQDPPPHQVVVVCDGRDEAIERIVRSHADRVDLAYHDRENDMSPVRSRRIGVREARVDHVVLVDSDVELEPGALREYSASFDADPEQLIVGKLHTDPENDPFPFCRNERLEQLANSPENRILFYKPYLYFYMGNVALTREMFVRSDGLGDDFVGYAIEDVAFAHCVHQQGYRFQYNNAIRSQHHRRLRNRKTEYYKNTYTMRNLDHFRRRIAPDVRSFFEGDEEAVVAEFERVAAYYDRKYVCTDLVRYFLYRGLPERAMHYRAEAHESLCRHFFRLHEAGGLDWRKIVAGGDFARSTSGLFPLGLQRD